MLKVNLDILHMCHQIELALEKLMISLRRSKLTMPGDIRMVGGGGRGGPHFITIFTFFNGQNLF